METDVDVEIPKTGFPHRLAKRLLAFRTVPTGPAAITTTQGWAKSDDQNGPNQVDKTNPEKVSWIRSLKVFPCCFNGVGDVASP